MMITLYTFGPAFGLPDPSPFVVKAEMLLKIAGLPYQVNSKDGMGKAPKGKLPLIDDDGELIADSTFIRWHLEKKHQIDFDKGLSSNDKALCWAVEKMLEDNMYWALLESRWCQESNFAKGPSNFFKKIPWPMRPVIQAMLKRKINNNLKAHGMGRHSRAEMEALAARDLAAVAALLGDKPYFMGSTPCGIDATLFGFIGSALAKHFDTPIRTEAEKHANLVAYVKRMQSQYYPQL